MYEQSVVASGAEGSYGVPGPSQVTCWPSPIVQITWVGAAVAVTVTGPAEADAVSGYQAVGAIQSQVGTFTSCSAAAGGAISMAGEGSGSSDSACWARAAGLAGAGACWAPVTQTRVSGLMTPGPVQLTRATQTPGVLPPGARAACVAGPRTT